MKIIILAFITLLAASSAHAAQFNFVALGDTAYNLPKDLPVYDELIGTINESNPAFSIHVGDIWGAMKCTEKNYRWIKTWFEKYQAPVVYTPGDNEWTDCRKPEIIDAYIRIVTGKGSNADKQLIGSARTFDNAAKGTSFDDTLEALATIRKVYFDKPESLGKQTMPVVRQSDISDFTEMKENLRWQKEDVVFATIHVPGSEMNFTINDPIRANDAIKRNEADVAWIKSVFNEAKQQNAKAVVLSIHASLFVDGKGDEFSNHALRGGEGGPYYWIAWAIRDQSEKFGKPVLLINGDFHEFVIDRPFMVSQGEDKPPKYGNIMRLQVYGAPELKAVTIAVDTDTPWVFSFSPLY